MMHHGYSKGALIAIACTIVFFVFPFENPVLSWDAFGYYIYLPMYFYEHTVVLETLDYPQRLLELYEPSSTLYQFPLTPNGNYITRYPVGIALAYLPFFAIGHIAALITNYPIDGFSAPYDIAAKCGSVFYYILGFYFLRKLLLKYYDDLSVAIAIALVFIGSNIFYYSTTSHFTANGLLFTLYSIFMYGVDSYLRFPNSKKALAAGAVFGLIVVCRYTGGIIIIAALLWPMVVFRDGFQRQWHIFSNQCATHIILFGLATLPFILLQLIYWKIAASLWFIDSYGNPGEGLDLLSPHTFDFLFSFKSGWFVYTPFMLLASISIVWLAFKKQWHIIGIGLFLFVFLFVTSSWSNWWYGGGFSQRAMIESLPFFAFPIAEIAMRCRPLSQKLKYFLALLISITILLNLWHTYQYKHFVITPATMTRAYYFKSFFDRKPDPAKAHLLLVERFIDESSVTNLPLGYQLHKTWEVPAKHDWDTNGSAEFTPAIKIPYFELCPDDHCWLELVIALDSMPLRGPRAVMAFERKEGLYKYTASDISERADTAKASINSSYFYLTPEVRSPHDLFITYIWNPEQIPIRVKKIELNVYVKAKN